MTARSTFLDAVRVERRTRAANTSRELDQDFEEVAASVPCRIVDQTETASSESALGRLSEGTALLLFLPEEDVQIGDLLTSIAYPTLGRKWRVTSRRLIDRHSLQCSGPEVRDQ